MSSQLPDSKISQSRSLSYWNSIPPTVDGMLGGYPQISRIDLRGSLQFVVKLRRQCLGESSTGLLSRSVDCGAGIGRVTAGLLSKLCETVDIVEPVEVFAAKAKSLEMEGAGKLGEVFETGLENWIPNREYDLIWNQWCLCYLRDEQLVAYLKRCKGSLSKTGWIVIKENLSSSNDEPDIFDIEDSSVTRTHQKYKEIFTKSGLIIIRTELQKGFPKTLYPVRFYALQPGKDEVPES